MRKLAFYAVVGVLAVLGISVVADALVLTDEERLETFAEALAGDAEVDRIGRALRYVDTAREDVELTLGAERLRFGDGDDAEVATELRDALEELSGADTELVQKSVEIDGDEARVAVRLRSREGLVDAVFDLAKHGERWVVFAARIR
ncbi:MAG TPA: hypothetical protein RMH85_01660 [Polyangiaceae bacterium LLY-WYZ-15_(1-7)]|nr:hypothetical protein [Sandaracinus sp.]HJK93376.1 hypothetical protein [Polyangiaceae bacterium LLY-WYZ-15_(1-7)]HJL04455.1 hypothetical protein [Polyangiaceae bacterium LLY-WYZ-15_(1-7)]HJL07170.1 hypothetical protein [Polyangiaceae bacterium LLY-WYZ-15_(1-7)]HJL24863.1 hypothetical protein [Polyangiaceae bacterium LLY-WYZ-15_(1-7)]